ncbi:MAG TPA: hypothetical protein VK971_03495 [Thiohalobacter sp.]|nr:hypothetical protein [Thiohalobacter sp.]
MSELTDSQLHFPPPLDAMKADLMDEFYGLDREAAQRILDVLAVPNTFHPLMLVAPLAEMARQGIPLPDPRELPRQPQQEA